MFSDYWFGVGGPCERFAEGDWNAAYGPPSASYWCRDPCPLSPPPALWPPRVMACARARGRRCQPNGRTAGGTYFVRSPSGFVLSAADLPHAPYAHDPAANGAGLQYWRQGHWFSMCACARARGAGGGGEEVTWPQDGAAGQRERGRVKYDDDDVDLRGVSGRRGGPDGRGERARARTLRRVHACDPRPPPHASFMSIFCICICM